jgi:dihydropteroate synthase
MCLASTPPNSHASRQVVSKVTSYLRPVGRVTHAPTRAPGCPERLLNVGGRADLAFSGIEVIDRHGDGWIDRRLVAAHEIADLSGPRQPNALRRQKLIENLQRPRGDVAGLSFEQPRIMGIVNITPDSFSDGGHFLSAKDAVTHALQLDEEGADILDIGGESTRPGSEPVTLDDELRRIMPVIEALVGRTRARISVDTRKAEVMRRVAVAGAHILNDVSALGHDAASLRAAAETRLCVILMHSQGDPRTMQKNPTYDEVVLDVFDALESRVEACLRAGIPHERLFVDPGIGFGKTVEHNVRLLGSLSQFHALGTGVLVGASRKSFIGALSGAIDPLERVPGSIASALAAVMQGAQILRVHDVAATRQALTIWQAVASGTRNAPMT